MAEAPQEDPFAEDRIRAQEDGVGSGPVVPLPRGPASKPAWWPDEVPFNGYVPDPKTYNGSRTAMDPAFRHLLRMSTAKNAGGRWVFQAGMHPKSWLGRSQNQHRGEREAAAVEPPPDDAEVPQVEKAKDLADLYGMQTDADLGDVMRGLMKRAAQGEPAAVAQLVKIEEMYQKKVEAQREVDCPIKPSDIMIAEREIRALIQKAKSLLPDGSCPWCLCTCSAQAID